MKIINFRTTIAGAAIAAILTSGSAATDVMPINQADESAIMLINSDVNLYVNGLASSVNAKEFDGKMMLPLRGLCEALGMNVGWDNDTRTITIEKMPVYITCTPDADGYTFARTAPQLLGSAPILENGTTYVPMNFADEILGAKVSEEDGVISIDTVAEETESEAPEAAVNEALLTAIGEENITIYDTKLGEVVANITEETVITDAEGKALEVKDLTEGVMLEVKYAEFMTMSLPPITNALEIKVTSLEQFEVMNETVVAVGAGEEAVAITVGDKENPAMQTVINFPADKAVVDVTGEDADAANLSEGAKIMAIVATASTRSLPPQRTACFIRIAE